MPLPYAFGIFFVASNNTLLDGRFRWMSMEKLSKDHPQLATIIQLHDLHVKQGREDCLRSDLCGPFSYLAHGNKKAFAEAMTMAIDNDFRAFFEEDPTTAFDKVATKYPMLFRHPPRVIVPGVVAALPCILEEEEDEEKNKKEDEQVEKRQE